MLADMAYSSKMTDYDDGSNTTKFKVESLNFGDSDEKELLLPDGKYWVAAIFYENVKGGDASYVHGVVASPIALTV